MRVRGVSEALQLGRMHISMLYTPFHSVRRCQDAPSHLALSRVRCYIINTDLLTLKNAAKTGKNTQNESQRLTSPTANKVPRSQSDICPLIGCRSPSWPWGALTALVHFPF